MAETIAGMNRTHRCGELTNDNVGEQVVVMGWTQINRDLGGVIFIDLRDITGLCQIVFDSSKNLELFNKADSVRSEDVIAVAGEVVKRAPENVNLNIPTGEIEIRVSELRVLSRAETSPILIEKNSNVNESLRNKYRYIDLRRPDMQENLILRHKISKVARDYYDENGFIEIETPMLTKSTPEGARDYLVPSRIHPGKFYALPQSPQIFKQLLMVSGYDRYFQIVKCFRDEDLRADRQPEFTQIDMEMSFVHVDDVLKTNEGFIKKVFKEVLGLEIKTPFKRLTYKESMDKYGTDKPDTRYGLELENVSDLVENSGFKVFSETVKKGGSVRVLNAKGCGEKFSRREIDALVEFAKQQGAKGMAWISLEGEEIKSAITKFFTPEEVTAILERAKAEPGDLICFIADKDSIVFNTLSNLRFEIARKLGLIKGDTKENKAYNFVWITEFPLLEYDEAEKRWVAIHHPFTSPMDEDVDLLDTNPEKVRAKSYDIVLNGVELGGGSIRIHDLSMQSKMFNLLGFSNEEAQERFGFLLEAFKYGAPPHGGMAYGLDRLVMLMAGQKSIRDVIAFPKVQNASCPLSNAPDIVSEKQLKELHIRVDV